MELALRLVGMVILTLMGARFGQSISTAPATNDTFTLVFGLVGSLVGLILTPYFTTRPARIARNTIRDVPVEMLFAAIIGLILGVFIAALLAVPLSLLPPPMNQWVPTIAAIIAAYVCITIFTYRSDDLFSLGRVMFRRSDTPIVTPSRLVTAPISDTQAESDSSVVQRRILMDSSAIIDGRILDISQTGFLSGELIVPNFILREIQHIADESNPQRRARGRRGLEILEQMQQESKVPVSVLDIDVENVREADHKLVALAKKMNALLLTTDSNLRSTANLQGVEVLNINDLALAVKTMFLPKEVISIQIVAEGREPGQGVGYLADGTMVVVANGKRFLDRYVDVVITKSLQTANGKMYFANPEDNPRK